MVKLIDTHAHLQFEKFDIDRTKVISENSQKLLAVINPSSSLESSEKAVELATQVSNFYAAVGIHPHHVDQWQESTLLALEKLLTRPKVVALGEIGLDNHEYIGHPKPNLEKQSRILVAQIELALKFKRPILFHCRKAYDELYNLIKKYQPIKGLLHCFMGDLKTAQKFIDLGLLISFAGNLTYKSNLEIQEAARVLPANKIVIETDSPFLTPEPLRGQRNEPFNVLLIAQKIADLRKINLDQVADFTTQNAKNLFAL